MIQDQDNRFHDVLAKFDSGADNCSLDEKLAEELGLNQNFVAEADIINANGSDKRPVIEILFQLKDNSIKIKTYATLADRSDLDCPLLIGRNALQPNEELRFLINPETAFKKASKKLLYIATKIYKMREM